MTKSHRASENETGVRILRWKKKASITQEEAEALLHKEGYQSICWYDVPGAQYPKHLHTENACIWVLKGEIHFVVHKITYVLKTGDRIYLSAGTLHQAVVPTEGSVTYLIGESRPSQGT